MRKARASVEDLLTPIWQLTSTWQNTFTFSQKFFEMFATFPPGADNTRSRYSAAGPKYGSIVVPGESHRQNP